MVVAPMHWISPRAKAGFKYWRHQWPLQQPRANQCMDLIDKKHQFSRTLKLIHHRFDAFFELTTVFGARDHHGQVQDNDRLITQKFRHIPGNDQLGQSFDDGGLTDTASPKSTGLFFVRRERIWITRSISFCGRSPVKLAFPG